jgi:aspartate/methionine/tyrosine aminotransferase
LHRDVNAALMPDEDFEFECRGRGLGCVLMSNPANPTGQSIEGEHLKKYVDIARKNETALM